MESNSSTSVTFFQYFQTTTPNFSKQTAYIDTMKLRYGNRYAATRQNNTLGDSKRLHTALLFM